MRLNALMLMVLFAAVAAHGAVAHEWYDELEMSGGVKCCGERDCAPYPHRTTAGEIGYELLINGKWYPVPPAVVLGMFSPDGMAHGCCYPGGCEAKAKRNPLPGWLFRCVIVPGSSA